MMVDLIVENGRIHTGDPEAPVVDAVTVLNGRNVAAGNDVEGPRARERVDVHDRVVLPGFNDAHAHSVWFGMTLMETDLSGVRSLDDLYRIIGDRACADREIDVEVGQLRAEGACLRSPARGQRGRLGRIAVEHVGGVGHRFGVSRENEQAEHVSRHRRPPSASTYGNPEVIRDRPDCPGAWGFVSP